MMNILVGFLIIVGIILIPYLVGKITLVSTDIDANEFLEVWTLGTLVIVATGMILGLCYLLGLMVLERNIK